MTRRFIHLFFLFMLVSLISTKTTSALTLVPQTLTVNGHTIELQVPKGLQVEFLFPLQTPRLLATGPDNELIIGSKSGALYRAPYPYTSIETLVELPGRNISATYRNGMLFAAQTSGLYSAPYINASTLLSAGDFSLVTPIPAATGGHSSRTVVTGPDQQLYISIGISGNCSDEYLDNSYPFEQRRGGVFLLDESGNSPTLRPFSSGLRNPVGLTFHPETNILYATNAGPDNLGFDQPPEILAALESGSYHGMPWFQYMDGEFSSGQCASSQPPRPVTEIRDPVALFLARSTPLGLTFVTTDRLGTYFEDNAVVAIHGSWAKPSGGDDSSRREPKIVMVNFENQTAGSVQDIITGFQRSDGSRFARPAGVIVGFDGNLYFTSDGGDVTGLFRLTADQEPNPTHRLVASTYILLL